MEGWWVKGIIFFRYDRFTEAFEHVSGVIDDIYKVLYIIDKQPSYELERILLFLIVMICMHYPLETF